MGADDAADGSIAHLVNIAFPNVLAVLDVFQQHGIGQAGIAQHQGHAEVHTASLLDFLDQQVVAHLGASSLAQHIDFTIHNRQYRLDVQQRTGKGNRLGDSAALFQVFQRIHQGNDHNTALNFLQLFSDLLCFQTFVQQLQRIFHQDSTTDGYAAAVYHIDIFILCCSDHGALIGSGELGGQRDNHSSFPRFMGFFIFGFKSSGSCLAGGRMHIGLHQLFIESLMADGNTVHILLLAEMNGQRHNVHLLFDIGHKVRSGIHNNSGFHFNHSPLILP